MTIKFLDTSHYQSAFIINWASSQPQKPPKPSNQGAAVQLTNFSHNCQPITNELKLQEEQEKEKKKCNSRIEEEEIPKFKLHFWYRKSHLMWS